MPLLERFSKGGLMSSMGQIAANVETLAGRWLSVDL